MSGFTVSKRLPITKGDNKMEDLWCIENAGVDVEDFANITEYRRFLKRFCHEEEEGHRRRRLYTEETDVTSILGQ